MSMTRPATAFMSTAQIAPLFAAAQKVAIDHHAAYPQYTGHFAKSKGWKLARIKRQVTTKAGDAFMPGDIVLARTETIPDHAGDQTSILAYSARTKVVTAIGNWNAIEFLTATPAKK